MKNLTSSLCPQAYCGIDTFGRNWEISPMKLVLSIESHSRRFDALLKSFEHWKSFEPFDNLSSFFKILRVSFVVQGSWGFQNPFGNLRILSINGGLKSLFFVKIIGFGEISQWLHLIRITSVELTCSFGLELRILTILSLTI